MTIDIENDTLLSLEEVCDILPRRNGKKVHRSTVWRWCREGSDGTRLAHVRLGRNIYTTLQALNAFAEAVTEHPAPNAVKKLSRSRRPESDAQGVQRAKRALAKDGI